MKTITWFTRLCLLSTIMVGATGCFSQNTNDLISGGVKLANDQIGQLTAGELQAVSGVALGVVGSETGQTLPALTPEQAQAMIDFMQANNLNRFEDFEPFINQADQDPTIVQGVEPLAAAFGTDLAGLDPNNLDPQQLWDLLARIFGEYTTAFSTPPAGTGP